MDEKSEMQNGEQFAPTSTPEEIPAEYRKTVRKEDGSPFTGEDLRAMVETVIPCIEEVNGEIRKIYLTSNKLLSDNPPPELDKTREIVRYAGSPLFTVMDDLGRMEALTFLSQEGAELERRRRRQIKTNRDAIKLLNSAPEPWIKNVTLTVFFEQQGSNPDFADLFLMDFVQAAFDIENGWAVREGPFKGYIEHGKSEWESGTGGTGRNMMLQSTTTNTFTKANSRPSDQTEQTEINGKSITTAIHVSLGNTYELLTLDIETASQSWHVSSPRDLRVTTLQLFDYMTLLASNRNNRTVSFYEKDYMAFKKLKDGKSFREQLQGDIDVLSNTKVYYAINKGTKEERNGFFNIIDFGENAPYKGRYTIGISSAIWDNLKEYSCPMFVPDQLFSINPNKNPHSYYFLRKIAEHKNMNIGKENEDIISIRSLLNAAMSLPTIEEVTKLDRNARTRIIKPFERDMNELGETIKWRYCTAHGCAPTCDTEKMDFSTFIDLNIKVEWLSYPDQTARLAKAEVKNNEPSREEAPPRRRGRPRKSEKK